MNSQHSPGLEVYTSTKILKRQVTLKVTNIKILKTYSMVATATESDDKSTMIHEIINFAVFVCGLESSGIDLAREIFSSFCDDEWMVLRRNEQECGQILHDE